MFDDDDFSGILTKMGLSELQIKKTKDFIDYYYPVLDESFIHNTKVQFNGDSSFFVSIDMEDGCELFPVTILVDGSGNCVEMDYPIINVINKDLILGTKVSPICIENCENPYYYKNYTIIEKQVIMNSKGEILYEGELGDVNKARLVNHYLLLEKDKYTDLQKEQIYFYCDNCIPGPYDYSDYIECPVCENDAEWDEKEDCYICSECKTQIEGNHINEEQAIAIHEETIKKLAVLDFSEVFISEDVKAGKYICDTPEEREERVINEALCSLNYS